MMLNTLSLHPPHNKRTNDDTNSDVKMKKSTFKILFLIRRNQVNKDGKCAIFKAYTAHCRYKGKFHKQLHQRRMTEWMILFVR